MPKIAAAVGIDQSLFEGCLISGRHAQAVDEDVKEAMSNGGRGTPYSIFLLKDKASTELSAFADSVNAQYGRPGSPVMGVSKDEKKLFMSGALPYEMVKQIVDLLLK